MKTHITKKYDKTTIPMQAKDGYVHATAMCKAFGKRIGQYNLNNDTKAYLEALSGEVGIPTSQLVIVNRGGRGKAYKQGTWVHPLVAVHLAQWLDPNFAVWVSKLVFDWQNHKTEVAAKERPAPKALPKPDILTPEQLQDIHHEIAIALENSWPGGGVVRTVNEYCSAVAAHFGVDRYSQILGADFEAAKAFIAGFAGNAPFECRDITLRRYAECDNLTDIELFEQKLASLAAEAMNLVRERPLKQMTR